MQKTWSVRRLFIRMCWAEAAVQSSAWVGVLRLRRGAADAGPGGEARVRPSQLSSIFSVPDIHAAYGKLKESGVPFEDEPHMIAKMPTHDLWMTFFRDSEGNLLALMSEVA